MGIAHHHWSSIPHLLRQDGSPPAYYMLLGLWIRAFGQTAESTHILSVIFAVGCIPFAYWVGKAAFDRVTGWYCAALAAFDPYLTYYAQETRMYSMEAFLGLIATLAWVKGIGDGRRRWLPVLALVLTLMVYVHNWALFLCVGLAVATALFKRERLRDFLYVGIAVIVLYLPWVPTLLSQAKHTGAPWATRPNFHDLVLAPGAVLSGDAPFMAFVLAGGVGFAAVVRRRHDRERMLVLSLSTIVGVTVLAAWVESQISPAWTTRYFAVVLRPAAARGRAGALPRAAARDLRAHRDPVPLVRVPGEGQQGECEQARGCADAVRASRDAGHLDASRGGAGAPLLPGLRPALGEHARPGARLPDLRLARRRLASAGDAAPPDPRPVDRDGAARAGLHRLHARLPRLRAWTSTWTKLVWQTSEEWTGILATDPQVRLVRQVTTDEVAVKENYFKLMQAFVYRRVR